ncbi:MAG TPA: nuclear transport factor 2 family protein [Acidiferrobacterales bacterium]|nr:nuclear transport factor 2 family protein [Acidiferrobacterales bacterium]
MNTHFDDPARQEVWKTLRTLNDAWTKGRPDDLKTIFHEDMVAITATDRERLEGREACFTSWNNFAKAAKVHHWKELKPRIQIYGNTAVVTYYFDMSFEMGGQMVKLGGRDMFVFVKEGGKWWAVADQFSPYPAT